MADKAGISSELSRELTLFHITMMGLGMMIGAGVFLGIGNAIHVAGPGGVLLTFLLNGLIAMFTAFSYAELSSAIPHAGGAFNFARIGLGRGPSFVAGWMEWFASSVAGSLYAVTFAIYVVRFMDVLGWLAWCPLSTYMTEKILAVVIAGLFFLINYQGASETGKIGAMFTLGQTLFLVVIGIVGVFVVIKDPSRLENFDPFLPGGWGKLLITMGFTYVAFEGYEVIAQAGDEAIDPKRNLPKAMLYSVYIVTLTYVLVAFAAIVAVKVGSPGVTGAPWEWIGSFRERGFGEAVAHLLPAGNLLLTLAVIFASTSALNATIYSATRALYALGRDHMLPPFLSKISRKRKTPWVALAFTGALVLVVATLLPTMDVASSASMMFLILFFLVNICVIKIRRNLGDELSYGFVMPFFPILPIAAIICQGVLAVWLIHMSLIAWVVVPVWIICGVAIYHRYAKSHALTSELDVQVLEEAGEPEGGDEYRIMLAVANPLNAIEMVNTTHKICEAKQGRIELVHMVPVPEQSPLRDAERYMLEGREAIVEAMLYLDPLFPLSSTIWYCRNAARGLVNAARQRRADMLLLGWHGRPRTYGFSLGRVIDPILERSPCDVVVLRDAGNRQFKRVLVPLRGGPNARLALEVASILVEEGGTITVFTVASDKSRLDIVEFVRAHGPHLSIPIERISTKAVYASNVVNAILEEAENHDMMVMGLTLKPRIYQVARETIPESLARRCTKPLVMVQAVEGIRSWVRRWV